MKNIKLLLLTLLLGGGLFATAQETGPIHVNPASQRADMAGYAETSARAKDAGDRFASAADYLKFALVLGLGILLGRISAVSHRELREVKTTLARLTGSGNQPHESL